MNRFDDRLAALWALDEPRPTDPLFTIAVMRRIERRQFWSDIVFVLAPLAILGSALLWLFAPVIDALLANGLAQPDAAVLFGVGLLLLTFFLIPGDWQDAGSDG